MPALPHFCTRANGLPRYCHGATHGRSPLLGSFSHSWPRCRVRPGLFPSGPSRCGGVCPGLWGQMGDRALMGMGEIHGTALGRREAESHAPHLPLPGRGQGLPGRLPRHGGLPFPCGWDFLLPSLQLAGILPVTPWWRHLCCLSLSLV